MARTIAVNEKALEGQGEWAPIPDGAKLRVVLYDIEETTVANGDNKGKPQAMFTVKVVEDGEFKNREVKYNYFPLYPGAGNSWFLTAMADALGWPINREDKSVEVPDDLRDALGTEFIAKFRQVKSQKVNPNTGEPYINNNVNGARKAKASGGGITEPPTKKSWDAL